MLQVAPLPAAQKSTPGGAISLRDQLGTGGQVVNRSLAIVVVTHNSADDVVPMLSSIRLSCRGRVYAIIVVDNGSDDGTVELLHREQDVLVVEQANEGFARGVNRGLQQASPGHDVLVLNPDTRLDRGAVVRLIAALDDQEIGIVVPTLRGPDGVVAASLRRDPTVATAAAEALLGGRHAGRWGESYEPVKSEGPIDVDWATGAAMLLRRDMVDEIGLLDESFFLYSEETEYCMRARAAGFRVRVEPEAEVTHIGGDMSTDPRLWALRAINRVRLYERTASRRRAVVFRIACLGFELRRALLANGVSRLAVRSLLARDLDRRAQMLIGEIRDGRATPAETARGWICFSAQDYWYHNRGHSDVQLMRRLGQSDPVLLVNSIGMRMPMPGKTTNVRKRLLRKLASIGKYLRRPEPAYPGLHVMSPVFLPMYKSPAVRRLNGWLVRTQVRVISRVIGLRTPAVIVTLPTAVDVIRGLRRRCLVVNRSDRYSELPDADSAVVRHQELTLLGEADVVVFTSHRLMQDEAPFVGGLIHFLDHGVDLEHFRRTAPPDEIEAIPRPRAGFFGGIDDYVVDLELLGRVAELLPDVSFVLIGDATCSMDALLMRPNVHWLGKRPYEQIPALGSGFDVALMPWLDNEWIKNSNPIKLKEYLALGLPIVTTPFPELDHQPESLHIAVGASDFAVAIEAALGQATDRAAVRGVVENHSWDRKAEELQELARKVSPCAE